MCVCACVRALVVADYDVISATITFDQRSGVPNKNIEKIKHKPTFIHHLRFQSVWLSSQILLMNRIVGDDVYQLPIIVGALVRRSYNTLPHRSFVIIVINIFCYFFRIVLVQVWSMNGCSDWFKKKIYFKWNHYFNVAAWLTPHMICCWTV